MLNDTIITVENLGKKYRIRHQQSERYTALRDVIARRAAAPLLALKGKLESRRQKTGNGSSSEMSNSYFSLSTSTEEFWALRDINFEVKRGEVLGIIGRNGAGKTTLLKILSRITEPTEGRVRIKGRVASLLEVGTGFHPELTGRENIFLNGAILGMARTEIRAKFDEIVSFAEVERFLDTPVKRYSSGMYVRLAFAVAAHLDPEILVVDEVLAVGDAEFQKKCLGKMDQVAHEQGRTVLFVSHNMPTINRLCLRALLLESGRLKLDSDVHSVTGQYMTSETGTMAARRWTRGRLQPGDDVARLLQVRALQHGVVAETVDIRHAIELEMTYENRLDGAQLLAGFSFFDSQGIHLFVSADLSDPRSSAPRQVGIYKSICHVPGNLFGEGIVRVAAEVATRQPVYKIHFLVFDSVAFQVVDTGEPGSVRGGWGRPIPGVMRPQCEWHTEALPDSELTPSEYSAIAAP